MILDKSRKHAARIRHILGVLARHGLGAVLVRLGLGEFIRGKTGALHDMTPTGVREALEELGPTFVKLGQILSMRPDLILEEYAKELSKLQDTASRVPTPEIIAVIEQEFGRPVNEVYASFNDEPIAAASLGQVHIATLHDGRQVIVKVQRPGIHSNVESDIEILYRFARLLENKWERARIYGLTELVDEFALTIREELDYTREARNTERLRSNLSEMKEVRLPQVFWELTTPRVLTIEMLHGIKVTDIPDLKAKGYDLKLIASRLASVFLKQIYVDGFFHADPHPGNILVLKDQIIGLVDCGQVGRMDATARSGAIRMLIAFQEEDTRRFAEEVASLGIALGSVDVRALTRDLEKLLRGFYDVPARSLDVGALLTRTLEVSARHQVRLPASFAVMGKVLANVDSINRQLDPDFNFTEAARPYVTRAVRQEFSVPVLSTDLYRTAMDLKAFLLGLPENLEHVMRKMVEGTLRIEFKHEGLDDLSSKLDKAVNRLAFALIVVGIIIASSLIIVAGKGPRGWLGLPTLGLVGYLMAGIFGIFLLIQMIRSGSLH